MGYYHIVRKSLPTWNFFEIEVTQRNQVKLSKSILKTNLMKNLDPQGKLFQNTYQVYISQQKISRFLPKENNQQNSISKNISKTDSTKKPNGELITEKKMNQDSSNVTKS